MFKVIACSFFLNEYSVVVCPSILSQMVFPMDGLCSLSTFTVICTWTPVETLRTLGSGKNGSFSRRQLITLCVLYVTCSSCMFLYCLPVLQLAHISYCMALLTSAQAGIDRSHVIRCCSVIPRPLVRSSLVFKLYISTCSTIEFTERPTHRRSLLLNTFMTLFKYIVDICMIHICYTQIQADLVQKLCRDAVMKGSISDIAAICSAQFPVCSVLRIVRIMSTVSMYCNIRAAVLLEYVRVLFLSISFIRHQPDKPPRQSIIPLAQVQSNFIQLRVFNSISYWSTFTFI